jgi:hypothetical protein
MKHIIRIISSDPLSIRGGMTFVNLQSFPHAMKYSGQLLFMSDGWLMCCVLSVLCWRRIPRYSFDMTSLAPRVFERCIVENRSIFFLERSQMR